MLRNTWLYVLALLLAPCLALAQTPTVRLSSIPYPAGGVGVGTIGIYCMDSNGYAQICSFTGGVGGGAVTQGAQASSAAGYTWFTQDVLLDLMAAPVTAGTATATKSALMGCQYQATKDTFTTGQQGHIACDANGRPIFTADTNIPVSPVPQGGNGANVNGYINAAGSCMATSVKSSTGSVFSLVVSNSNSSAVYFNLFASASAPTCGSGTPLIHSVYVPPTATVAVPIGGDFGGLIGSGIGFDVVTAAGDTSSGTIATANTVSVTVVYK